VTVRSTGQSSPPVVSGSRVVVSLEVVELEVVSGSEGAVVELEVSGSEAVVELEVVSGSEGAVVSPVGVSVEPDEVGVAAVVDEDASEVVPCGSSVVPGSFCGQAASAITKGPTKIHGRT
jgi:hypothetical protein